MHQAVCCPRKLVALLHAHLMGLLSGNDGELRSQGRRKVLVMFLPSLLKANSTATVRLEAPGNNRNRRFSLIADQIGCTELVFCSSF